MAQQPAPHLRYDSTVLNIPTAILINFGNVAGAKEQQKTVRMFLDGDRIAASVDDRYTVFAIRLRYFDVVHA